MPPSATFARHGHRTSRNAPSLELIQPAPAPFGDVTLDIRPPTEDGVRQNPTVQVEYDLQPLAEMHRLAMIQESLTDQAISADSLKDIADALKAFISKAIKSGTGTITKSGAEAGASWIKSARSTLQWIEGGIENIPSPSPIFAEGNSKLPYAAFSALPGVTCPGAGLCLKSSSGGRGWCYSFRAWRYPAAFFRQFNNTLLLRTTERAQIRDAFMRLAADAKAKGKSVVVRLYVDGDIDSMRTLKFWMDLLHANPQVQAYGYSKSWDIFLEYDRVNKGRWPSNYALNLSSGSKWDKNDSMIRLMQDLPITRGAFVAVPIPKLANGHKVPQNFVDATLLNEAQKEVFARGAVPTNLKESVFRRNPRYTKEVQESARVHLPGRKVFVCPGKCGNCLPSGQHACGNMKFRGVPIAIGIH